MINFEIELPDGIYQEEPDGETSAREIHTYWNGQSPYVYADSEKTEWLTRIEGTWTLEWTMELLEALPLKDLFSRRVSLSPRPGWRPVHLSWRRGGTYTGHCLIAGEQITKNKCWICEENGIFYYRFLLRLTEGRWMIDHAQQCREGRWVFCGL